MSKQEIQGLLIGLVVLAALIVIVVGLAAMFGYIPHI